MARLLRFVVLVLFCAGVGKVWHVAKDGFHVRRVQAWDIPEKYPLSEEAKQALEQPFYYIGRGHQCYAFESKDQKYVLKLPRTDRYHPPFWMKIFPEKWFERKRDVQSREKALLESFRISFEELQDQTAVLAWRMGSEPKNDKIIQIKDRLGRTYNLSHNETPFLLQRKFPILMRCFEKALKRGQTEEAAEIINCFIDIVHDRAKKGILNKDPSFLRNFGYDGIRAYQIDVGSFYRKEGVGGLVAIHKSMRDTVGPVREWLLSKDPDLAAHLDKRIDEVLR